MVVSRREVLERGERGSGSGERCERLISLAGGRGNVTSHDSVEEILRNNVSDQVVCLKKKECLNEVNLNEMNE